MTYEVKAFNSNATREPVVRVTSNKSRPQRIEQETRAARASIDAKVSLFILLTRGTIFEGNPFCRRTLLIIDFILMSRIFSFPLKNYGLYNNFFHPFSQRSLVNVVYKTVVYIMKNT